MSDDEDALLDSLENETANDPSLAHLREVRLQQLATELARAKTLRNEGYGTYLEIKDEKTLLDITTSYQNCIVHFFKSDFNRCRIMDGHLKEIAEVHLEARCVRIEVENAPFLVTKLGVKVLPCVIAFVKGVGVDRVIGFEGLGYSEDTFATKDLEARLMKAGVLNRIGGGLASGTGGPRRRDMEDSRDVGGEAADDDDWD